MMGLSADLSTQLDAGAIVQGLLGAFADLAGPVADLLGFELPIDPEQLRAVAAGSEGLDASAIAGAVGGIAELAAPLLARIPGVGDVMTPITGVLELVEQVTRGTLLTDLQAVLDAVAAELEGGAVDVIAALSRAAAKLQEAPALSTLLDVLLRLVGAGERSTPPAFAALVDVLPALDGTSRLLAGLTTLESVLSEAERITTLAAGRLNAGGIAFDFEALESAFRAGSLSLADWLDGLDAGQPAEVAAALTAVRLCADRLTDLAERIAAGMAFGEASLAYLDVGTVLAEVQAAAEAVRTADLAPGRRLADRLHAWLQGLLPTGLAQGPASPIEPLLARLETEVQRLAGELAALDPTVLAAPLSQGLGHVTGLFNRVGEAITTVTTTLSGALGQVRDVITALPLERVATALRTVIDPVTTVLDTIRRFIDGVQAAVDEAVRLALAAMGGVEGLLDRFKDEIDAFFAGARSFVERLDLEAVAGAVREKIQALADLIAQANLEPYFDTAISAVGTAASVVEKIPLNLLPESMKAEVDAAVRPIKEADIRGFSDQIQTTVGIGPDGFAFRQALEAALSDIQAAYDRLMAVLEEHSPRKYLKQLDDHFDALATRIREFAPDLRLEPVQAAIDQVKAVVAGVDLDAVLAPIRDVFTQVEQALEQYSPERLIEPVEARLAEARQAIVATLRLDRWRPTLTDLRSRALGLLGSLDPARLEPLLVEAFARIDAALQGLPAVSLGSWLGGVISGLFAGTGPRLYPERFEAVLTWITGNLSGTAALNGRAERIAQAVGQARDAVRATDVQALGNGVIAAAQATRAAATRLSLRLGGEERIRLEASLPRLDAGALFGTIATHRTRYLATLDLAAQTAETLRRTGLSEVDVSLGGLRAELAPLRLIGDTLRGLAGRAGIGGLEDGVIAALRRLLATLTPARLAGLLTPIFSAAYGRVEVLLDAVILPLLDGIAALEGLVAQITVQPLIEAVAGIRQAIVDELALLHPDALLSDALTAFRALQTSVGEFDPLGLLEGALDQVKEGAARLIEKLSAERLLESPLAIYEHILQQLRALSLEGILTPILDRIDDVVRQLDAGLDGTVTAFERLQAALPGGGGGSSASASVSVS